LTTSNEPEIGMGATIVMWSDRLACTIVQITHGGKRIVIQRDTISWIPNPSAPSSPIFQYSPNPQGGIYHATKRKDGSYRLTRKTTMVWIGTRQEYYDRDF
jgi:hypothetical protein